MAEKKPWVRDFTGTCVVRVNGPVYTMAVYSERVGDNTAES